jgi:hypothetical protein
MVLGFASIPALFPPQSTPRTYADLPTVLTIVHFRRHTHLIPHSTLRIRISTVGLYDLTENSDGDEAYGLEVRGSVARGFLLCVIRFILIPF